MSVSWSKKINAIVVILATFPIISFANIGVPVLLFGFDLNLESVSKPLAGHTIPTNEFSNIITSVMKPGLAVTFLQDELSSEDFLRLGSDMKRGGLFKNLQTYSTESSSRFFPSVKAPSHALRHLDQKYDEQIELKDPSKALSYLNNVQLQKDTSLIIHLNPTGDEETSSRSIKKNDELIGAIMKIVEKSGLSYIAFYTGKSHRSAHSAAVVQGVGRHLLQVEDAATTDTIFSGNSSICLLYMESVTVGASVLSDNASVSCTEDAAASQVNITITDSQISSPLELIFTKDAFAMWSLVKAVYNNTILTSNTEISAPVGFSYHCSENITFSNSSAAPVVEIARLQIQVFSIETPGVFDSAYDCTGFFTIAIWTGLLTALVLIGATVYGLMMLNNIQTFDLYDDPKGKPLTINLSE